MTKLNSATRILPGAADEYIEPASFNAVRDACATNCLAMAKSTTLEECIEHGNKLAQAAIDAMTRFQAVYAALMPFAKHGTHMSNMKLCLFENGRQKEPAGGMWLNGLQSASLQPNEHLFYEAIDAVGRKAVEDALMADFELIQQAGKLMKEKEEHLAASTLAGPVGGPVTNKLQ